MKKVRILVVDDNAANLEKARRDFYGKNVKLTCCSIFSVAANLISLDSGKFDILLTDLMMPGEADGVYKESLEIGKEVPYGLILAILAKNKGIEHVAIMTNINHHSGPIPWAMDRILGENQSINAFYGKDYLAVATKFLKIIDLSVDEKSVNQSPRIIMAGVDTNLANILARRFQNQEVLVVPSFDLKWLSAIFLREEPQAVVLIGEIVNPDDQLDSSQYVGRIFKELTALKKPEQRIITCGWLPVENQVDYLRLPFTPDDLYNILQVDALV